MSDSSAPSGTGAGLLAFLEWAGKRGEVKPARASALLTASRRMFEIDPDYLTAKVSAISLDEVVERFENLHRLDYSAGSLRTYESRLRTAAAMYLSWLAKDPNWKSGGGPKSSGRSERAERPKTTASVEPLNSITLPEVDSTTYDLPLRKKESGGVVMARLALPAELSTADAERIANFVRSLAFEGPTGTGT